MIDPVKRAWIVAWESGGIGIAYETVAGVQGAREVRSDDPDLPELRMQLSLRDRVRLDEQLNLVVVHFRRH